MEYALVRSRRKTVAICILPGGTVEVRAPLSMPKADIDRFVLSKQQWIQEKLLVMKERSNLKSAFHLDYGDRVLVMGKEYPITLRPGNRIGFDDTQIYLVPGLSSLQIKDACVKVYMQIAKQVLTAKAHAYGARMGVTPSGIKINFAKTRWGSCSAKKSINFSWRLIMAEEKVIDLVVVHELAHIKEMNHSIRFWAIVEGILPDYKERQLLLKALQKRLGTEDWG
jgi:predicted metal-dependent hydrolase